MSDSPLFSSSTADRRVMAAARGKIAHNRAEFAVLESAAVSCEDPLEAVALTRMAYEYAMLSHPGSLASAPLERLLHELGSRLVPGHAENAAPASPARVLHVATEVYESGGHGRVLERWIEHDRKRVPTVLFVNGEHSVPDSVVRAVAGRNGHFARVSRHADTFSRAAELRHLASQHELVVLHIHNHEVMVAIALADPVGRPPTILVNHASHLMWAGVGCSDVVVSFSDLDAQMCVSRRGVPAQRSLMIPLPSSPRELPTRAQARAALGLDPDAPVILTMGSPYKLRPVFTVAHRDLAKAALEALPQATLLLVGPRPEEDVVGADPRVRVLGVVRDPSAVLAAADILIDSWPITGGTTVIDAAAAGLAIVALADPPRPMLSVPESALNGAIVRAADLGALRARLRELGSSAEARADLGRRALAAVEAQHDAGWSAAMENIVLAAGAHRGAGTAPTDSPAEQITEWEAVIQAQRASETQRATLPNVYARNLELVPAERRPLSMAEVNVRIELARSGAPKPARVIAAPRVEHQQIGWTVAQMRELITDGTVLTGVILVAPELIDDAVRLIEPAIAEGAEIDIELQVGNDPAAITQPGDVVLVSADHALEVERQSCPGLATQAR